MNKWLKYIEELKQEGEIGLFELEFARFISTLEPKASRNLISSVVLLVNDQLAGNICTDLTALGDSVLASKLKLSSLDISKLINELKEFDCVGKPGEYTPIILDNDKLYLHKYWSYENELTGWLKERAQKSDNELSKSDIESVELLFRDSNKDELNLQKVATSLALIKDFLIISGGPGTGKTFTVNKIIDALKQQNSDISIALAAPTGKAAERLSESIDPELDGIEASTLHKLLGARKNGEFKFNKENKLYFDVIIIDEASMLDLRLWISLIRALRTSSKLILLGDKDQLASVEAGSILGDICINTDNGFSDSTLNALKKPENRLLKSESKNIINNHVVLLEKSYRAKSSSGISEFGKAINEQDVDKTFQVIDQFSQIDIKPPSSKLLFELIDNYTADLISGENGSQFLCSNKKGKLGTIELNKRIESSIKEKLKIPSYTEWYVGRKIIITKNDFSTGLKNGEIGTCYKNDANEYCIRFGSSVEILTQQLKHYDLAYTITVHKSQGSEFKNVFLFLSDTLNSVLTKELLYTAVTRARESTLVIGNKGLVAEIIQKKIKRISSISQKIQKR
ncbi:MAG: exodeoxyribonuclease V subunit alpha [Balneola sp.]